MNKTTEAQEPSRFKLVEHFVGRERRYSKALELACSYLSDEQAKEIADAMPPPEELAEPVKQEPVAMVVSKYGDPESFGERELEVLIDIQALPYDTPFYAAPVSAKREWVDLTDDELKAALEVHQVGLSVRIGRIAIAAFKEKNK